MGRPNPSLARETLHVVTVRHDPRQCVEEFRRLAEWDGRLLGRTVWGCIDGIHAGWVVVEAADERAAIRRLPESIRPAARAARMGATRGHAAAAAH
jgi:hypothetical protein